MNAIVSKIREFLNKSSATPSATLDASPSARDSVPATLDRVVHADTQIIGTNPISFVTSKQRWAYAVSFPIALEDRLKGQRIRVVVSLKVYQGRVGIGVVCQDKSTYIAERQGTVSDDAVVVPIPSDRIGDAHWIVVRNTATGGQASEVEISSVVVELDTTPVAKSLHEVTLQPFKPKAFRAKNPKIASINTTDVCNLSCVMCHFNGPNATKKADVLKIPQVEKVLREIPAGEAVWFCATGEFFIDPNALHYLKKATSLGLKPCVLSHGQLFSPKLVDDVLEAGVRMIRMSVDSTDPDQYRKIRRGGELANIIEACEYLRTKKADYPDLRVEINATLFKTTVAKQQQMEDYWRPLVDQVNFNAEYFNTFEFRNVFYVPDQRVDCDIEIYVMPSGRIVPCCAMAVYQHDNDVSWLPHIDEVKSLDEAYQKMCDIYEDPNGPMASICAKCDWWIMFMPGNSPYIRAVDLHLDNKSDDLSSAGNVRTPTAN